MSAPSSSIFTLPATNWAPEARNDAVLARDLPADTVKFLLRGMVDDGLLVWGGGGGGTSRLKVWPTWGSGCLVEFVGQLREAENNLVLEQELERSGVCTEVDEAPGVVGMPKVYRRRLLQPTEVGRGAGG